MQRTNDVGLSVTCQPLSFALSITPGEVTLLALVNTALQLTSEGKPHEHTTAGMVHQAATYRKCARSAKDALYTVEM